MANALGWDYGETIIITAVDDTEYIGRLDAITTDDHGRPIAVRIHTNHPLVIPWHAITSARPRHTP